MFSFPEPLHPALVHFPIVLILVGSAFSITALYWRKSTLLPWITAILFLAGAVGAVVAVQTGERDQEFIGELAGAAEQLLDEHEDWAKRTQLFAIVAAVFATGTALGARWPRWALALSVLTVLASLGASYCVYETGHRGGKLVYQHAVGVSRSGAIAPAANLTPHGKKQQSGEDTD